MVNNNIENISTEFEKLDWKEGLSEKEQRMLSVYWEITDENEKKSIISNIKRLNSLNAELQSINWKIDLIDTLAEQDIEKTKFKQAIKDILREKNRIIQLEVASKKSGTDKRKELLKWKSIDNISARDLLDAENEGNWFLSKTFAYKISKDENGEEIETPLIQNDIKEKDLIKIDFGKNRNANYKIWAADILPTNIKVVKISDHNWETRIWLRSIAKNWRVGYYDNSWYIPVFNNYTIEIPTKDEEKNIIENLSKTVEISNDENAEKEAKTKYLDVVAVQEKRDDEIRKFTIDRNRPFMENSKLIALEIEKVYWIPWQVTVWQWSLESGWWKSWLASKYNNIFWVKASKWWKWEKAIMNTTEYDSWGNSFKINDWFRVYSDMKESFIDYANFLTQNPRYKNAFKYWVDLNPRPEYYPNDYIWYDPEKFIEEIADAWYATDPRYSSLVKSTWEKYEDLEKKVA